VYSGVAVGRDGTPSIIGNVPRDDSGPFGTGFDVGVGVVWI